jgi:phosphosulfolactate synthase (CoM biosynthesis protein A)
MNQERAFSFIPLNAREAKPRRRGLTEIRGPYYSVMGERYLTDVLETMGWYLSTSRTPTMFTSLPAAGSSTS